MKKMNRMIKGLILACIILLGITGIVDSGSYLSNTYIGKSFSAQDVQAKSKKNKQKKDKKDSSNKKNADDKNKTEQQNPDIHVEEDGKYISKDEVAAYIHEFHHLPSNYIRKKDAQKLGWDSSKGNLDEVAPGMSIGGDRFGNHEGILPEVDGRTYTECDINYEGGYRGAERIIFSNEGQIYYTNDHYQTFTQLY